MEGGVKATQETSPRVEVIAISSPILVVVVDIAVSSSLPA